MNQAIICLSFDDGRRDGFCYAAPLLKKYQIPATFSIATAYIEKGKLGEELPEQAMTKEQVCALAREPLFEIAAHGHMHRNSWQDIETGRRILMDWLKCDPQQRIGFASPGSGMTEAFIQAQRNRLEEAGFLYVRTGYRIKTHPLLRSWARKAARITHGKRLYAAAYAETLQDEGEGMAFFCVPVLHDTALGQLLYLVERAKRKGQCCTILFHSITPRTEAVHNRTWSWDSGRFEQLLRELDGQRRAGQIRLMTSEQAFRVLNGRQQNGAQA